MKTIQEMLSIVNQKKGSDLHLITSVIPTMRVCGEIRSLDMPILNNDDCKKIAKELLNEVQFQQLEKKGDVDIAYTCESLVEKKLLRVRVNVFKDHNGVSFAFRLINDKIPLMEDLMIPISLRNLVNTNEHGFIIVTGPTGSGKTTTLATMIDYINESKYRNIITLEDPIEYLYGIKRSIVSQREIGKDCVSFSDGLKAALRQDPDVILVGEMRDKETIETALNAAETGHLVFTTLHTSNVVEAIDRVLQYFPATQHKQIQAELANCFLGIVAQKLIPRKNGSGRIAAFEVLLKTSATENLIRNGEAFRLKDYMRPEHGMLTMDVSIQSLQQRKLI